MSDLQAEFGPIDIYLFDQLLRGRIRPSMRVLDAGCGAGRNLVHLLRGGYEVFGTDSDAGSIESVRRLEDGVFRLVRSDSRFAYRGIWRAPTGEVFVAGTNGFVLRDSGD